MIQEYDRCYTRVDRNLRKETNHQITTLFFKLYTDMFDYTFRSKCMPSLAAQTA